jgi:hypothetical protein
MSTAGYAANPTLLSGSGAASMPDASPDLLNCVVAGLARYTGWCCLRRSKLRPNLLSIGRTMNLTHYCCAKAITRINYHHNMCLKYHISAISRQIHEFFIAASLCRP